MSREKDSPDSYSGSRSISSGGNSSSTSTPAARGGAGGSDFRLVLKKQPPSYLYSDESFNIEFSIDMAKSSSHEHTGDTDAELVATLHHLKSGRPVKEIDATLTYEPQSIWLSLKDSPPRRKKRIRCKIRCNSIRKDKIDAYCIQIAPRVQDSPLARELVPVSTSIIRVVNHKIKVETDSEWENMWFKDEGGRDKCMTVTAGLYDKDNNLVKGGQIPLQVTLFYANNDGLPIRVTKQDTMRTIGATKQFIEKTSGLATVRFRIEDVSKNHQNQEFCVEIAPDSKAKGFKDIAPGFSPAVQVRSKRNKRPRAPGGNTGRDQRLGTPPVPGRSIYDDGRGDPQLSGVDMPRIREALKGVINWTEEVVNGLCTIQWQVIGYHQNPDGSTDYNRPYHNIPNPEPVLSRVMGMYSDTTREQLMIILRAIDRSGGGLVPHDPYAMNMAPLPIPRGPEDSDNTYPHYNMPPRAMANPMMHRASPYAPGIHPSVAKDAFREKAPPDALQPQHLNYPPAQQHLMPPSMRPMMPSHTFGRSTGRQPPMAPTAAGMHPPPQQHQPMHAGMSPSRNRGNRESEVAYVLARQYKSLRTGERFGFPAYNIEKELLGFYTESTTGMGHQFIPIDRHREDFGPIEIMKASEILHDEMNAKSEAVHALKNWGSIQHLLDHAIVSDYFGKDMDSSSSKNNHSEAPLPSD